MQEEIIRWLLSSLVQADAAIWGIFTFVFFSIYRKSSSDREIQKTLSDNWNPEVHMILFNYIIFLAIVVGVLGLVYFGKVLLVTLTVILSLIGMFLIMLFVVFSIKRS